jgi:hypothetical protein
VTAKAEERSFVATSLTVPSWHISAIRQSLLWGNELPDDVHAVAPTALGGK